MFYSHQLLSKKGPFGQIWIAATMHPKMNRKKTDQVDIEESCMQIINPVVPLALRLSGILMGGIVRIYNHKVKFFYDDVNQFMLKMQTKPEKSTDTRTLPARKTRAKHEDITLDSVDDLSHDLEQPMLQPDTPEQDDDFFTVPSPVRKPTARANRFQAENEDITLDDNVRALSDELDDPVRDDNPERFQQPSSFIDDDIDIRVKEAEFQSDFQTPDGPEPNTLSPIVEEPPAATTGTEKAEDVRADADLCDQGPKSPEPQRTRKRRPPKRPKKLIIDEERTEVPADLFQSWLEDRSSITHRKERRKAYTGMVSERAKAMLGCPSTFLALSGKHNLPQPLLHPSILELWTTKPARKQDSTEARESKKRRTVPPLSEDRPQGEMQTPEQSSKKSANTPGTSVSPQMPTFDFEEPEQFEAPLNFEDFGSAEKLRSAARTPMSEDSLFDSQLGVTPTFSGNSTMTSKRGRTSQSDKLPPDEYLTPATRSKRSRLKNLSPLVAEMANKEFFERTPDISVIPDAEPSRAAHQRELDKLTSIMLQYLREHFTSTSSAKELSLENLTDGMNASQAAKMFYHVCVLVSNQFLSVKQNQAYADIIISRGNHF